MSDSVTHSHQNPDHLSLTLVPNPSPSDARRWLSTVLTLKRTEPSRLEQIFGVKFIDTLHKTLLVLVPADDDAVQDGQKLLSKAVLTTGLLPSSLIIRNVSIPDTAPPWVPSFPGAFCGELSGRMVTVKPLRLSQNSSSWENGAHEALFYEECLLLSQLDHPSLVPFLGVAVYPPKPYVLPTVAVFPWYDKGTVRTFMDTNGIDLDQVLRWTIEFTEALVFLHDRQVPLVHGDLRADNILVTGDGHVRLSGFAFGWRSPAITWQSDSLQLLLGYEPFRWRTQDRVTEDIVEGTLPSSDMWSWGCTVYEIFMGDDPYCYIGKGPRPWERRVHQHRKEGHVLQGMIDRMLPAITRPQEPEARKTMPVGLWELVNRSWSKSPDDRPSAAEALSRLKEIRLKENTE